jgi:imidazolonepropionase-like amidohydrolase
MISFTWMLLGCAGAVDGAGGQLDSAADSAVDTYTQPDSGSYVFSGGIVVGLGPADVEVRDGDITVVGTAAEGSVDPSLPVVDVSGLWLVPAFIDSHVHLVYDPRPDQMADGGLAAVVDLAAPVSVFETDWRPLRALRSGPMVTAQGGYPTTGWGANGYGLECEDASAAVAAVESLHALGAGVIKLPVTGGAQLDAEALLAAADRAHALGLPVASHALGDSEALLAAQAGADVLAHTPTGALEGGTCAAWSGKAVISTLAAFGGGSTAVENLKALREAGATVLYGTDFGNSRTTGIDGAELALLGSAGLDGAAILVSGTSAPAEFWGFDELGSIAPGKAASLLVLRSDPLLDPSTLADPQAVYLDGVKRD